MRRRAVVLSIGLATALAVGGCQTITEELPSQPSQPVLVGGQPAVVVVPVQLPSPTAPQPAPEPQAPGDNPAPNPAPTSRPLPTPTAAPGGGGGGGGQPSNNAAPVRLGAKVFFVECDGRQVPDSEHATEAPVGCRVHLDVTPKDANNQPTRVSQTPNWTFSDPSIIKLSNTKDFTPTFLAIGRGSVSCYAEADGLRSNTVTIRLN